MSSIMKLVVQRMRFSPGVAALALSADTARESQNMKLVLLHGRGDNERGLLPVAQEL